MKREEYKAAIEAILFVSPKPITIGKIREHLKLPADTILELLLEIREDYKTRGINLISEKRGYRFVPNEKYKNIYRKFAKVKKSGLSRESLETIAILLKSDATKQRIDKLRGVNSTRILNSLIKKGFVSKVFKNGTVYYTITEKLVSYLPREAKEKLRNKKLFK